jgi:hypothetical protein
VNPKKLIRQLRRETVTNPKKAVVLGLLLVVALYFWVPRVVGWFGPDKSHTGGTSAGTEVSPTPGAVAAAPLPPASLPSDQAAATAKPKEESPKYSWRQLVAWMENDPHTKPCGLAAGTRDPFQPTKVEVVEVVEVKKEQPKPVEPDATPQSLNLVLSSTILGPNRRVARINGTSYEQGGAVEVTAKDGRPIVFTLTVVEARRVVLQRQGKEFELILSSSSRSGRPELLGSAP